MKTGHRLEFFTDEDGSPWACFAWGAVPPETITRERILEAADYHAGLKDTDLDLDDLDVSGFWIRTGEPEGDYDGATYYACRAGDEGAIRVTGVRFQ